MHSSAGCLAQPVPCVVIELIPAAIRLLPLLTDRTVWSRQRAALTGCHQSGVK